VDILETDVQALENFCKQLRTRCSESLGEWDTRERFEAVQSYSHK